MPISITVRAACAAALLLAAAAGAPTVLHAQDQTTVQVLRPVGGEFGGQLFYGMPAGEFGENVDWGWGLSGHGNYFVQKDGWLGLRVDFGFMNYGNERIRECLTASCRVMVDVHTSYNVFMVGAGPQLAVPDGAIRPYIGGQAGVSFFTTQSRVEGSDPNNDPFATSENFSSSTFALFGYGGIKVPLSHGRTPVALDMGARYASNGEARYLTKDSFVEQDFGPPLIFPRRTQANYWMFYIGFVMGIR